LSKLIFWYLGDVHHEIDKTDLEERGDVLAANVKWRFTGFVPYADPVQEYTRMLSELTVDQQRNLMIAEDVAAEAASGGVCLVLSDRKAHCENLRALLKYRHGIEADLLTGDLSDEARRNVIERLNRNEVKVLVATGQLVGEGFDSRMLTTLFLTTPIRFSGRVLQYLGRVLRPSPGKEQATVYDYVDINVGVLKSAAKGRERVYGTGGLDV
jgi:superfamily II DNA or RNA helicase